MNVTLYQARKESGLCTRCGIPAVDGAQLCEPHLKDHRQRQRLAIGKKRQDRAKAGRCIDCGGKAERGATRRAPRCPTCRIAANRHTVAATTVVASSVDNRSARIAAATRVSRLGGEEGRTRYYGKGKRGKPRTGDLDAADLKELAKAVTSTLAALQLARSPEMQARPRIQRADALTAAWSILDMGLRFAAEAMARNGHVSTILRQLPASSE